MNNNNLFNFLPILGTYRLTTYKAVILRAPPTLLRFCVIFEVSVAIVVFIVAYYYTATTPTTETIVTFETMASPYTCTVLSPRSDTEDFSDTTSELAAYSQARYDYTGCYNALGQKGYDVCADGNREDYLLTLSGIGPVTSTCYDIILENNYRFCQGEEAQYDLRTPQEKTQFTTYTLPSNTYSNQYYFMNSSSNINVQGTLSSTTGSILSDYVSDRATNVFVIQETSSNSQSVDLYKFSPSLQEAKVVAVIDRVAIYGLTYGNQQIFTWTINNNAGTVYKYDLNSEETTMSTAIQCINDPTDSDKVGSRYISYGSDGKLYAICTSSVYSSPSNFSYLQIDPVTWSTTSYTVNLGSVDYVFENNTSSTKISTITQVFRIGHFMYFIATGAATNLLQADLTNIHNQGTTIQNVKNLGFVNGGTGVAILGSETDLYFVSTTNQTYFDTTSMSFEINYPLSNSDKTYFLSTYVQLGFSYQICNGNYSHYQFNTLTSSGFADKCDEINGIYYQNNLFYDVPESCKGYLGSEKEANSIVNCPAVISVRKEFVSDYCEASFDKICSAEYTDNPPFSCSKDVYPSFLSTIGTASADSSGAWSAMVIIIQLLLKFLYPHGSREFEYDEKLNRFLPVEHEKHVQNPKIQPTSSDEFLTDQPIADIESGSDEKLEKLDDRK